jgi:hypothetical protein
MTTTKKVELKDSLTTRLLLVFLGIYLVVTTVLTVYRLIAEYKYEVDSIQNELAELSQTFQPVLAESLWQFNYSHLHSSLLGMVQRSTAIGIKIENEQHEEIESIGIIRDKHNRAFGSQRRGKRSRFKCGSADFRSFMNMVFRLSTVMKTAKQRR